MFLQMSDLKLTTDILQTDRTENTLPIWLRFCYMYID